MKWAPFSSTANESKYHLASADDVRGELKQWKRRYYILATIYILTILLGVAYFPMSDAVATGAVLSEAYFGNSMSSSVDDLRRLVERQKKLVRG